MLATIDQVSDRSFDYIIVGGGTAGLVVAARLSEDPSVSVLVLEAGSPNLNDPAILIPGLYGSQFGKSQYDWGFSTVPQVNANGKPVYWGRGKGLGGSSSINFFQFHPPSAADIDAFEKLGNKGWNWKMLKKYYTKQERFSPPEVRDDTMCFDVREHGLEGPLEVAYPQLLSGLEKPFVEAIQTLGISLPSEPARTWLIPLTIGPTTRTRTYAANMYYEPNASRSNLTVLTSAHVARISLSKVAGREATAESVSFLHDGKEYRAIVKKEVIVSAGSIMSPQVLELSGIGDPAILREAGVQVAVDLQGVGNNIQEHCNVGLSYQLKEEVESSYLTYDCLTDPDTLRKQTELYHAGEQSILDMRIALMTFVPLSAMSPDAEAVQEKYLASVRARIEADEYPPGFGETNIKARVPSHEMVLVPSVGFFTTAPDPKRKYVSFMPMMNQPFSRGSIHIKTRNPLDHPVIDPRYFEQEYDVRAFAESFKFTRRLAQQEPFKKGEVFPGPSVQTDEEIINFLKDNVRTTFHTVGSCSMLPREDGGVVDNKLKVYGTTNIRVIDLSIIPLHIGAHTQATAYAIGELGADIIKGRVDF
ncbi:alcohol oxidase [Lactifluus subvellereus]|nr:alcohol oxidase [Lactifluus subvellereus]